MQFFETALAILLVSLMSISLTMQDDGSEEADICPEVQAGIYCRCSPYRHDLIQAVCRITQDFEPDDKRWKLLIASKNLASLTMYSHPEGLLTHLPHGLLGQNNQIKDVVVNFGSIKTIPSNVFQNSTSLSEIDLSHNQLLSLEPYSFAYFPSLETMTLSYNNLTIIKNDTFLKAPSLKYLQLDKNQIQLLDDDAFSGLRNLQELDLSGNLLRDLKSNTFKGLSDLTQLELGNNKIRELKNHVFSGLSSIQDLYLRENEIEFIDPTAFHGASTLMRLYLSKNRLMLLHDDTFKSQNNLIYLDLRSNNLESLTEKILSSIPSLEGDTPFNIYILVSGNKFKCDCRIQWMLKMVKIYSDSIYKHRGWSNITCSPPLDFEDNKNMKSVMGERVDGTKDNVQEDFNVQAIEGQLTNGVQELVLSDAGPYLEKCPKMKNETKSGETQQTASLQTNSNEYLSDRNCSKRNANFTSLIFITLITSFCLVKKWASE